MSRFGFRSVHNGDGYLCDLIFSTNPRLVPIVRRFVNDFYKELFNDEELVSRLALATHELMENVIKYSTEPEGQLTIEVTPKASDPKAIIRVRNRVSDADASRVGELVAALGQSPDPFQFYLELMARTARQPDSGLGLTRVRVEGDMTISHSLSEGCLEITATADLEKET